MRAPIGSRGLLQDRSKRAQLICLLAPMRIASLAGAGLDRQADRVAASRRLLAAYDWNANSNAGTRSRWTAPGDWSGRPAC